MIVCAVARCDRPVFAKALCSGHYQQQRRGQPFAPLRSGNLIAVAGLRVSPECAAALETKGPTAYEAAQAVLERWSRRQ